MQDEIVVQASGSYGAWSLLGRSARGSNRSITWMVIMSLVLLPSAHPTLFCWIAAIWCLFQSYVGWEYGLYICDRARKEVPITGPCPVLRRRAAYGFHHSAFYGLCTLAGFLAWSVAVGARADMLQASASGAVLVALAGTAVLGVSGALPRVLYLGNRLT